MEKILNKNDLEMAIAGVTHNLECVEEAIKSGKVENRRSLSSEKARLRKLLNKYIQMRKEVK